jgi:hypothetical protein
LWRSSPDQQIKKFELTTVTYGTSSAPFLATSVLHQLASDEKHHFPGAAEVLQRDFHVDDLITAASSLEEAEQLQGDLITLLSKGGFTLQKFSANHSRLLERIPTEWRETQNPVSLNNHDSVKTLGLLWNPSTDQFLINNSLRHATSPKETATKRAVASVVASNFDPLGLISPIIITHKVFLQQLWLSGLGWDDQLPEDLHSRWMQLLRRLHQINDIKVNRLVMSPNNHVDVQLHGFCDASKTAYGACLYRRTLDHQGNITVKLLCSKSRVAPVKRVTLPRLELCGAVLLANLIRKTIPILGVPIQSMHLFTDSTIVLAWLMATPTRKTFVGNRVAQIQELTNIECWKHVSTHENPADLISRGTDPETLLQARIW